MKYNRGYGGLKYGHYLTFGLDWYGSKSFGIFLVLPLAVAKQCQSKCVTISYSSKRKIWYDVDDNTSLRKFIPSFRKCIDSVMEKRG